MSQHKHAELMKMYAEDAMATNKPWEHWEHEDKHGWHSLSQHPCWSENTDYRRKPKEYQMTKSDWERVIDEGFYVTRSQTRELYLLDHIPVCNNVVVAREKGIRQPHFHGCPHPEGEQKVIATYDNGTRDYSASWDIAWGSVQEYILL